MYVAHVHLSFVHCWFNYSTSFQLSRDSNLQCLTGDAEHGQTTNIRPKWIFSFSIYLAKLASLEYGTVQCEQ